MFISEEKVLYLDDVTGNIEIGEITDQENDHYKVRTIRGYSVMLYEGIIFKLDEMDEAKEHKSNIFNEYLESFDKDNSWIKQLLSDWRYDNYSREKHNKMELDAMLQTIKKHIGIELKVLSEINS